MSLTIDEFMNYIVIIQFIQLTCLLALIWISARKRIQKIIKTEITRQVGDMSITESKEIPMPDLKEQIKEDDELDHTKLNPPISENDLYTKSLLKDLNKENN